MANQSATKRVSYGASCIKSLRKLPERVSVKFMDTMTRFMSDPDNNNLQLQAIKDCRDKSIKSLQIDEGFKAIAFEVGRDVMFVHVDEDNAAIKWSSTRIVKLDESTNRIRLVNDTESDPIATKSETKKTKSSESKLLFADVSDKRLIGLGVQKEELPTIRKLKSETDLIEAENLLDMLTHQILVGLAAGYSDEEIFSITGAEKLIESADKKSASDKSFSDLIETDESRQNIFITETEEELKQVFEGNLEEWRIFLHPQQRKYSYRETTGPTLVRGGAGTGKTVVAMHRAKYLADKIAKSENPAGQRVLFTTFTTNLARDIEANLYRLCPEHLNSKPPRIEVINLDRWVSQFLKRKGFERQIAYFGQNLKRIDEIWDEVFHVHHPPEGLSETFVKSEWKQIVQAKGLLDKKSYLNVARVGRGTALNRIKRNSLWNIFEEFRARMISEGLAEPDDAYREATDILTSDKHLLPYYAVVVDEAQDMGEQAFKLIRAIAPDGENAGNSIFIVGDSHQRIYQRKASMSSCGINIVGRSRRLKLNYRTSHEIRTWAVSVLEGVKVDDLDQDFDTLNGYVSLFHGSKPELVGYKSKEEELEGLKNWIKRLNESKVPLSEIGVLVHRNDSVDKIVLELEKSDIDVVKLEPNKIDNLQQNGVRVATMHRSKGLEFTAVAILFLSDSDYPPRGAIKDAVDAADELETNDMFKSLLHVAATRAKNELLISWCGKSCSFFR